MNNESSGVKTAGVAAGGTALTLLITIGELSPLTQDVCAIMLTLVVVLHSISHLVTSLNKVK